MSEKKNQPPEQERPTSESIFETGKSDPRNSGRLKIADEADAPRDKPS